MERNYELNVNCIAKIVIEKETAFLNTDFKSLGLYDKCRYLIHYAHGFHPSVDYGANRAAMISSLIPELRACAMTGDGKARAYLVFMLMRLGIEYKDLADFLFNYELKRENPYVELASLNMCFKPTDDDVKLAHKLLDVFSDCDDDFLKHKSRIVCYGVIAQTDPEQREHAEALIYSSYEALALQGDWYAIDQICSRDSQIARHSIDEQTRRVAEIRCEAWRSVRFLVADHFYNVGRKRIGERLITMLADGRGCKQDLSRAKEIAYDVFMSKVNSLAHDVPALCERKRNALIAKGAHHIVDLFDALECGDSLTVKSLIARYIDDGNIARVRRALNIIGMPFDEREEVNASDGEKVVFGDGLSSAHQLLCDICGSAQTVLNFPEICSDFYNVLKKRGYDPTLTNIDGNVSLECLIEGTLFSVYEVGDDCYGYNVRFKLKAPLDEKERAECETAFLAEEIVNFENLHVDADEVELTSVFPCGFFSKSDVYSIVDTVKCSNGIVAFFKSKLGL